MLLAGMSDSAMTMLWEDNSHNFAGSLCSYQRGGHGLSAELLTQKTFWVSACM